MEYVVVGCRGFGKYHLEALSKIDVDVSIVERDRETVKLCRDNYNIKSVYGGFDEAIRSNADMIDLVVPHNLHAPMALKALNAGKHVIVEKPLATDVKDARSMIGLSKKTGKKLMVAEQYYFDPSIARIRDSILKNEIGRMHTIIMRNQRLHRGTEWRWDPVANGGGSLIDGGIHFVDAMLNIGGEYEAVTSRCYKGDSLRAAEDTAMAIFDFTSGAKGLLFHSWAYSGMLQVPSYEIIGDNGAIIEDLGTRPGPGFQALRGYRAFGDPVVNNRILQTGYFDVFYAEIQGFIDSINNDSDVPFPPELALRDLETVLTIYNS
ncbi:MAG TPA: Gfo/Idh/MocA family oxidoreductase [Thermoplasmataceae archaeon]|nr:Gfo/Idh/MocA family oxidoreductase [Thermoplasmataceae archaeon]